MAVLALVVLAALFVWLALHVWKYESGRIIEKRTLEQQVPADGCGFCHAPDGALYWFYEYRFLGLSLRVSVSETIPALFALCPVHARQQCLACCKSIGKRGYWGIPGVLIAPCYVTANLWALKKRQVLLAKDALLCLWFGVVLGWLRPVVFLVLLTVALGVATQLLEN